MSEPTRVAAFWRPVALALAGVCVLLVVVLLVQRAALQEPAAVPSEAELPPRLELTRGAWSDLPGWGADDLSAFRDAFARTCAVFAGVPADRPLDPAGVAGSYGDWSPVCERVSASAGDPAALGELLVEELVPWAASNRADPEGLFTGYYEPSLHGSLRPDERYRFPLYRRPPELVQVDLGAFREELRGQRLAGVVRDARLVPFADRSELDGGALAGRGLELVWVDDPVAAFFLHIQGSGRVELADGSFMRVGYAAQNGHLYTAIGRELVARGELALEDASLQSIRAWLLAHPEEATEIMELNRSYVFFRRLEGSGPVGSQGVELTAGRSVAVDRTFLPLGLPIWLDTTLPAASPESEGEPLRRLLVAQDTGGAIRGPVRGDVFWGHGANAEEVAGRMRQTGRWWLLLPRSVTPGAPPAEVAGPELAGG